MRRQRDPDRVDVKLDENGWVFVYWRYDEGGSGTVHLSQDKAAELGKILLRVSGRPTESVGGQTKLSDLPTPHPDDGSYRRAPHLVLQRWLIETETTQRQLADAAGLSRRHANALVHGHSPIGPEIALRLEQITGIPAATWNRLQVDHEDAVLRRLAADTAVPPLAVSLTAVDELVVAQSTRTRMLPVLEHLMRVMATSSRDWATHDATATLYGVLVGWGPQIFEVARLQGWPRARRDKITRHHRLLLDLMHEADAADRLDQTY